MFEQILSYRFPTYCGTNNNPLLEIITSAEYMDFYSGKIIRFEDKEISILEALNTKIKLNYSSCPNEIKRMNFQIYEFFIKHGKSHYVSILLDYQKEFMINLIEKGFFSKSFWSKKSFSFKSIISRANIYLIKLFISRNSSISLSDSRLNIL